MKTNLFICFLILFAVNAKSQENAVTVSGGYASANIKDSGTNGTGYRINGLYEFNPTGSKFSHGVSFGFINVNSTVGAATYKVNSFPLYYAPKVMFGSDKAKFFLKGAIGVQFAGMKREGTAILVDGNDFGFYGGGGTGLMIFVNKNIFLNAEYEIAWASNSWYSDGWISTIGGGIGYKF
jgi:hypothetical protein